MAYRGRPAGTGRLARALGAALVVVLALVAGGLTVYALTAEPETGDPVPAYTPGALESNAPLPVEPLQPSGRGVVAVDGQSAWRYVAGECGVAVPELENSDDGGGTWTSTAVPAGLVNGEVLSAAVAEAGLRLSGLPEEQCGSGDLGGVAGFTSSGGAWTDVAASLAWSLDPFSPDAIVGPSGAVPAPCAPIDVDGRADTDLVVLCADQTVVRSNDAGATWGQPLAVPGAVAVAADSAGFLIAAGHQDACAGLAIIELGLTADDASGSIRGCVPVAYRPEETAMDARGATVWVWAGDRTAVSADGGASWR